MIAAIAPLSSGGCVAERLKTLIDIPVWAFDSNRDIYVRIETVRTTIQNLKSLGGIAVLTEFDSDAHDTWEPAFSKYDLLNWLLSQEKRIQGSPLPGDVSTLAHVRVVANQAAGLFQSVADYLFSLEPYQLAGQAGIPLILVVVFWQAFKRSRQKPLPKTDLAA